MPRKLDTDYFKSELVDPELIDLGDRFREDYGDLEGLKKSIENRGVINPIAVYKDGTRYRLIAGGRRAKACKELGKHIPCRLYLKSQVDEFLLRSIELEENIRRQDLHFIERAKLVNEIHRIYVERFGQARGGRPKKGEKKGHSIRDTAKLLNITQHPIIQDMEICEFLEDAPSLLEKCKTREDANKIIRNTKIAYLEGVLADRITERNKEADKPDEELERQLDEMYGPDSGEDSLDDEDLDQSLVDADDAFGADEEDEELSPAEQAAKEDARQERARDKQAKKEAAAKKQAARQEAQRTRKITAITNRYIVKDAIKGLKGMPAESYDFAEIDPPFGIDFDKNKRHGTSKTYNEVPVESYSGFIGEVIQESARVLKPSAWIIVWHGVEWYDTVMQALKGHGFKPTVKPAIWTKGEQGQTRQPAFNLASSYESFIYARRGNATITKRGRSNNFNYPPVNPQEKRHDTEKPIALYDAIFETFTMSGQMIVSPFMGSGSILLAAALRGLDCVGFDLSKDNKKKFDVYACKFLEEELSVEEE